MRQKLKTLLKMAILGGGCLMMGQIAGANSAVAQDGFDRNADTQNSMVSTSGAEGPVPVTLDDTQRLQGRFEQSRHLSGFSKAVDSSGIFRFSKKQGLYWRTTDPFDTIMVVNEDGMAQFVDGKPTTMLTTSQNPALKTFFDVLETAMGGNWGSITERKGATLTQDQNQWTLTFLPADDEMARTISQLVLTGDQFVNSLEIKKTNGDLDHIRFREQVIRTP